MASKTLLPYQFLLLKIIDPHYHQDIALKNMTELEQLIHTFGGIVVEKAIQHRITPNPDIYIGSGKLEWVKQTIKEKNIEVVVLGDIVNSGQLFRLEKSLWSVSTKISVWDKVDLLLNIFDLHATSVEAKLQIELARIQHLGPRTYGLGGTVLSRQGGGIGTRGIGETNIERERRSAKKRMQKIKKELESRAKNREMLIKRRKDVGVKTVALVGYTSAGKTSLFNLLTRRNKTMSPDLFTTLDTVVGKIRPQDIILPLVVSDTIGFIEDLPPFLLNAFRTTLAEALNADVILHVIDASDPFRERKIRMVDEILDELAVHVDPFLVFNKIDITSTEELQRAKELYEGPQTFFVSAKTGDGVEFLKQTITNSISGTRGI